jgi:dolichol-phosphate mannosyltransferase
MLAKDTISVVIPCFNEEKNIELIYDKLMATLPDDFCFEIIFVDDGSSDKTLDKIVSIAARDKQIKYISFSRNFGHQYALKAGIDHCTGKCAISLDSDLQHPPELISKMLSIWTQGYDVVYTKRRESVSLSRGKRFTSKVFYKFINYLSDIKLEEGTADFRLIDRKIINIFKNDITEYFLFIRGLVSWIGYNQISVDYDPADRIHGESKYSYKKMFAFAIDGITSFSSRPLRLAVYIGFFISILSFLYGLYAIFTAIFTDKNITGWTSIIASVLFIGGIQMILIGILGEYIGKIFFEVKNRPKYLVNKSNI